MVCGLGGHHRIHRLDGKMWKSIDGGVYIASAKGEAKSLASIDGTSASDLYAVGSSGVIFHFDGKRWAAQKSPTEFGLQRVLSVSKDEVYLCGNTNGLYRGSRSSWKALTRYDKSVTFWDMAWFAGKLYVCSKAKLFVLEKDELVEVKIPVRGPLGFYRMDARDGELWTCGNECVLRFDGKKWKQYVFPDNK
jgi:hypothetical protein